MAETPLDRLIRREEFSELIAALAEDGSDLLLVTLTMAGFDTDEIAEIFGLGAAMVRTLRVRLRARLVRRFAWLADEEALRSDESWTPELLQARLRSRKAEQMRERRAPGKSTPVPAAESIADPVNGSQESPTQAPCRDPS